MDIALACCAGGPFSIPAFSPSQYKVVVTKKWSETLRDLTFPLRMKKPTYQY